MLSCGGNRPLHPSMTLHLEQYRALVEHAPTMVWRSGPHGDCDYFNPSWLAFTGRTLAQELGQGWWDGVHPDDLAARRAAFASALERRRPFELQYRLRRFDGVHRAVLDRGVPFEDREGHFAGFVGSCVEVEDRVAPDLFSGANALFEMSLDNLCVAGFDGYFKRVNASWTRTLGWTEAELLSRPSAEFVHPEDRAATLAGRDRLKAGSTLDHLVNRYLCKDGSYRWFEWRSVSHVDRGLVYGAARDITAQKLAEERLREAQAEQEKLEKQLLVADRMASVGTLAAGVAHEINNPLTYVSANIALVLEELAALRGTATAAQLGHLGELAGAAQEGAERIRKIVRGLKTFSRAQPEHRAVIDVTPVLELSVDMAFNEIRHRARLVREYRPIPLVVADDAQLGQVFINLLVNAAQAIPDGDAGAQEIRVATFTDGAGRAVIEVSNTGPGIPAEVLGRVFEPFFTTKPIGIGTGLGLSVCHNIVTALGGEIGVTSEPGRLTTFRIALPGARAPRAAVPTPVTPAPVASTTRAHVLIVDDEPAVGAVLRRVLRDHQVTVVTSARAALAILRAGTRFDVILSDLMMPEMSGMDFYEELEQHLPEAAARVVFISGGAFTPGAQAFFERVGNERIAKPFDAHVVRDLVERVARG
jgi:PAS domain S-box-containing protein